MSALIFIVLALGYLHSAEATEQLSLTDFLLDFLLSLWVPLNYVPSNKVIAIPDPAIREQMISVEKSRSALDNYIEHLLRYASENTNNAEYSTDEITGNVDSASNQIFGTSLPLICNPQSYIYDYPDLDHNQLYPSGSSMLTSQVLPYPDLVPTYPVPLYPAREPISNSRIPTRQYEMHTSHYHGNKFIPAHTGSLHGQQEHDHDDLDDSFGIHTAHYHGNKFIPEHPHYLHEHHDHHHNHHEKHHPEHQHHNRLHHLVRGHNNHNHEPCAEDNHKHDGDDFNPEIEQGTNIFQEFISHPCDSKNNPSSYTSVSCGSSEEFPPPIMIHGLKRNAPNLNNNQDSNKQAMASIAESILRLATANKLPNGTPTLRMFPNTAEQKEPVLEMLALDTNKEGNEEETNKKTKRESTLNNRKEVNTRIFEDLYLTNFLDDIIKRYERKNPDVSPTVPTYGYNRPQYYNHQTKYYNDALLANRLLKLKRNVKGSGPSHNFKKQTL